MSEINRNENDNREQKTREIEQLEAQVEDLQRELNEEKNRHLRTRADFENYRKRMEREAETKRLNAKKEILTDLLTFIDYFEQARKQVHDPAAARGIELMSRQFHEFLRKQGVRPIECRGEPFDPEEHEGIGYMATDQCPEGCVAEEVSCGYKLGDILLKPARVMVAKKTGRPGDSSEAGERND